MPLGRIALGVQELFSEVPGNPPPSPSSLFLTGSAWELFLRKSLLPASWLRISGSVSAELGLGGKLSGDNEILSYFVLSREREEEGETAEQLLSTSSMPGTVLNVEYFT